MNLHRSSEVGRSIIFEPIVVSEPASSVRDGDELTGSGVRYAELPLGVIAKNAFDARQGLEKRLDLRHNFRTRNVDVSDLVIRNRKCCRCAGVEEFASELLANRHKAFAPKLAIYVNRI